MFLEPSQYVEGLPETQKRALDSWLSWSADPEGDTRHSINKGYLGDFYNLADDELDNGGFETYRNRYANEVLGVPYNGAISDESFFSLVKEQKKGERDFRVQTESFAEAGFSSTMKLNPLDPFAEAAKIEEISKSIEGFNAEQSRQLAQTWREQRVAQEKIYGPYRGMAREIYGMLSAGKTERFGDEAQTSIEAAIDMLAGVPEDVRPGVVQMLKSEVGEDGNSNTGEKMANAAVRGLTAQLRGIASTADRAFIINEKAKVDSGGMQVPEDFDPNQPISEKSAASIKAGIPYPGSGPKLRPITDQEAKAYGKTLDKALVRNEVAGQAIAVMEGTIDPIKTSGMAERVAVNVGTSVGMMAPIAIPYAGVVIAAGGYADQEFQRQREMGTDVTTAHNISQITGTVQAGLERLAFMFSFVPGPVMSKLAPKFTTPGLATSFGAQTAAKMAGVQGAEYGEEIAQDFTQVVSAGLAEKVGWTLPEQASYKAELERFTPFKAETFLTVAALSLVGGGARGVADTAQARGTLIAQLADPIHAQALGVKPAEARAIAAMPEEERIAAFKESYQTRDPKSEASKAAVAVLETRTAEAIQKGQEEIKAAAAEGITIQRTTEGWDVVDDTTGDKISLPTAEEATTAMRGIMTDRGMFREDSFLDAVQEFTQTMKPGRTIQLSEKSGTLLQELEDASTAGKELSVKAIWDRADEFRAGRGQDVLAREIDNPDSRDALEGLLVLGRSTTEAEGNAARSISLIMRGGRTLDLVEEQAENDLREAVQSGRTSLSTMRVLLKRIEAATGDKYINTDTDTGIVEAWSTLVRLYTTGTRKGNKITAGARKETAADFRRERRSLREAEAKGVAPAIFAKTKEYLDQVKSIIGQVSRLQKAVASGKVADLEAMIRESVGLKEQDAHEAAVVKKAGEIAIEAGLIPKDGPKLEDDGGFSIEQSRAQPADPNAPSFEMPDGTRVIGPTSFSIRAFHGTPHKVDRFSTDKMGTGEGAQVYGWGLYFAQAHDVAEGYRKNLTNPSEDPLVDGQRFNSKNPLWASEDSLTVYGIRELAKFNGDANLAIQSIYKYADENNISRDSTYIVGRIKGIERYAGRVKNGYTLGNTYTVELLPDEADFLDWDAPLKDQSLKVKAALKLILAQLPDGLITRLEEISNEEHGLLTGGEAFTAMRNWTKESPLSKLGEDLIPDHEASDYLLKSGIPGIKYLDSGSRDEGTGTSNFVIFDDKLIKILEENGKPVQADPTPSFSITPKQDAEYMAAVESGDVEKQQAMVDAAAKAAGYDVGPVWHGTSSKPFDSFNRAKLNIGDDLLGAAYYFSTSRDYARAYADIGFNTSSKFKTKGPWTVGNRGGAVGAFYLKGSFYDIGEADTTAGISSGISEKFNSAEIGNSDGVSIKHTNQTEYAVFNPNQIKSADPITRDESGNVIPLSERFNPASDSISYSITSRPLNKVEPKAAFKSAIKTFGLTRDIAEAGYILPDGRLLDFSGRAQAGYKRVGDTYVPKAGDRDWMKGSRGVDHREVEWEGMPKYKETWMPMVEFMNMGAVRIDRSGAVTIHGRNGITSAQKARLADLLIESDGELYLDMEDDQGKRGSVSMSGAKIAKLAGYIQRWKDGWTPDAPVQSYSITPKQDAEYMAAVELGNVEKQQSMVDAAAKAAGYDVGPAYHGTRHSFDVFNTTGFNEAAFFSPIESYAGGYGPKVGKYFLKFENLFTGEASQWEKLKAAMSERFSDYRAEDMINYYFKDEVTGRAGWGDTRVFEFARKAGFDGAEVQERKDHVSYAAFDPNQIKSADPITRDESGNVIPLSERFNPEKDSISYSITTADRLSRVSETLASKARDPEQRFRMYETAVDRLRGMARSVAYNDTVFTDEKGSENAQRRDMLRFLQALDTILMPFPAEVRGKVGGFVKLASLVTNRQMETYLKKRVEKLDKVLETYMRNEYTDAMKRLLKRAEVKKGGAGEKPAGTLGADVQHLLDQVKAAMNWNADEVLAHNAGLQAKVDKGELTAEQEALAMREMELVQMAGDWSNADATTRAAAVKAATETFEGGYLEWKGKLIAKREHRAAIRENLKVDTGKAGTKAERDERAEKDMGWLGKSKDYFLSLSSFSEVLQYTFGKNSKTAIELIDAEREAAYAYEDGRDALAKAVEQHFTVLAKGSALGGEKLRFRLSEKSMEVGGVKLSEMEAMQAILLWNQEDGKRHMTGMLDENGLPAGPWHYDQAWVDEVTSKLSAEGRATLAFIQKNYAAEWETLNPLYRERHGVNMPRHDNYAPITVTPVQTKGGEMVDPVSGQSVAGSILTPGSLRTRSRSAIAEPDFRDALQTLIAHNAQMEHWKAYYDFAVDAQAIFGNRELSNTVKAAAGNQGVVTIRKFVDYFAQGGSRDAGAALAANKILSTITGRAARMALVGRAGTLMIQATQLGAAIAEIPTGSYIVRLGKLMTGNLQWRDAIKSDFIQRRIKQMPPIVRQAMAGLDTENPNAIKHAVAKLGNLISGADGLFTAGTYAILLDYHRVQAKKLGFSGPEVEEYAHKEAIRGTERVAQPTRPGTRSLFENTSTSPMARLGWAFASEARQKIALAAWAGQSAKADPARAARVAFLTWVVGGFMAQVIRNAWRDAKDDDDDEWLDDRNWSLQQMIAATIAGPLQGIPGLGEAMQSIVAQMTGTYDPGGNLLSSLGRSVPAVKRLATGDFLEGDEPVEEIMKDVEAVLTAMGMANDTIASTASIMHVVRDGASLIDQMHEDTREAGLKQLRKETKEKADMKPEMSQEEQDYRKAKSKAEKDAKIAEAANRRANQ